MRLHVFGLGWLAGALALAVLIFGSHTSLALAQSSKTTVFAAASLKTALDEIASDYQTSTGSKVVVSYAASSALAKQIEQTAPADVFISADLDWVDYLAGKDLIDKASRHVLIGNMLVLVAPVASTDSLTIGRGFNLAGALGDGRLAIGDVKAVPAGKYAKAALTSLGVWESVESKLAQTENVRTALALVARGEAPFGIVYQSDAAAEPQVKVAGTFPPGSHPPIVYPVAVLAASKAPEAAHAFVTYLLSEAAQKVLIKDGFSPLK